MHMSGEQGSEAVSLRAAASAAGFPDTLADREVEHILLGGTDPEPAHEARGVHGRAARQRVSFNNRARRVTTRLTLYDDGCLGIREQRRAGPGPELIINLRYLDSTPLRASVIAVRALRVMVLSSAFGLTIGTLAFLSVLPAASLLSASVFLITAAVAFAFFIYRTEERIAFRTRHGQVAVLRLAANFGCRRACRALLPTLARAIDDARSAGVADRKRDLREEMREHYRLREIGLITEQACSAGMRRILVQFDRS